jgi:hypothetical protein
MLTFGHTTAVTVIRTRQVRKDTSLWAAELDFEEVDFVLYMLSFFFKEFRIGMAINVPCYVTPAGNGGPVLIVCLLPRLTGDNKWRPYMFTGQNRTQHNRLLRRRRRRAATP